MQIRMHVTDSDVSEALRAYIERRLRFALSRFGNRVGPIIVRLRSDGPAEHYCRMSAEILPFGRVMVTQSDFDLFTAIDRAAGKIGLQFGRELERLRDARVGRQSVRLAA
jgi:ribosome hibernation promoting factor